MTPPIGPAADPAPIASVETCHVPARLLAFATTHVITLAAVVMVAISAAYSFLPAA